MPQCASPSSAYSCSDFLAVSAAGLALQRVKEHSRQDRLSRAATVTIAPGPEVDREIATHSDHAGNYMMGAVQGFNSQLERIAELLVVMVTGAMLAYIDWPPRIVWFLLLLFLVARPVSVWLGLMGAPTVSRDQHTLISWFGIRGIGSIFYLMYAINHGLPEPLARELVAITLTTVAASVVLHGISVTPLMSLYARRKALRSG
jgi:NhaP-type Na+/H+ or K+/H+ antiporter